MKSIDLSVLPESAQQEVYDFFCLLNSELRGKRQYQMPANALISAKTVWRLTRIRRRKIGHGKIFSRRCRALSAKS